jgi:transposase
MARGRSGSRLHPFRREAKIDAAVRLVTDRGVAVAQAARDLDVAKSVLRRWMRGLRSTLATAFPRNGQMRAELAETAALKKRSRVFVPSLRS